MAVEDLYTQACDAVERNNLDYAIYLCREVLRQEPEHPDARNLLRAAERRRQQAQGTSVGALIARPFKAVWTFLKALFKSSRGKLETYEDYLESYPRSFWAVMKAAAAAEKAGFVNEATKLYQDAVKQKPRSRKALRRTADALVHAGRSNEAVNYLSRLVEMDPKNLDLVRELRDLQAADHMASHKMETAESFRDLIRDKEVAAELEESQRMAATKSDLIREIEELAQELEENPEHVARILRLARLYEDVGRLEDAHELLREKHELLPDEYQIRERLGDVQLAMYDKAIAALDRALKEDPEDEEKKAKRQELVERKLQFALHEFEWRHAQHPTDRAVHLELGRFCLEAGRYNEAIAAFQAVSQDPRYVQQAKKLLGLCFTRKGQYDLALEQFNEAVENHPEMDDEGKDLRYLRAQTLQEMGRREEALKAFKRIYSVDINFRDVARRVDELGE